MIGSLVGWFYCIGDLVSWLNGRSLLAGRTGRGGAGVECGLACNGGGSRGGCGDLASATVEGALGACFSAFVACVRYFTLFSSAAVGPRGGAGKSRGWVELYNYCSTKHCGAWHGVLWRMVRSIVAHGTEYRGTGTWYGVLCYMVPGTEYCGTGTWYGVCGR